MFTFYKQSSLYRQNHFNDHICLDESGAKTKNQQKYFVYLKNINPLIVLLQHQRKYLTDFVT